ncbi:hypothetical protein BFJ72_g7500 [Fusarium proliferatum]|uniref:Uncharacterized protein n=1 Tax=Gibberella intermedia TaxID=948311 RepID=A0A420T947_GIBIN|nr:hypothetical protein BFJ72_g7500 [Fusarium proliferatum]
MTSSSCLWAKARENLPEDVKDWLASLEQGTQPNPTTTDDIDRIIKQTREKQKDHEKSSHRFKKYLDKIIHWLDKFKGIGDVVSSFDPVHAALPWAAFRFALQAILAEREQEDIVLELLASIPHLVFSGRVLERVYTKESMHGQESQEEVEIGQQCVDSLHEELLKLYSALLGVLKSCHSIFSQHKVKRKATAIFNSSEVVSMHKDLAAQHTKVLSCGETCHKFLSHTLSRKSLDLLEQIQPSLIELKDRIRDLLVRIDESERRETLEGISSIMFRSHHDEISGKRTDGTCEWILKKEKFIKWEESKSCVTILYGSPGAGKTFIISRVIDYFLAKAKKGEALAFFYCKRDEENRRNPKDILSSILRQLSTPMTEDEAQRIHIAIKDLPNRLALKGTTINVSTCENVIRTLVEDYPKTTIILDALDECDRDTREELMTVLNNLTNASSKLRLFISSRHDEDILRHFRVVPIIEMQATDNEEDIACFVEHKLFQDSRWSDISVEIQDEVKTVFHEKSQGMFQWAALQVHQIRRLRIWTERSIKDQIEISPVGLKAAYDVVWNQLQEMSPYEEQLARRAFQWVLCAFRPLKTPELSLMMHIDPDSGIPEASIALTPETIQSICGNLLVYDQQSSVWRFSHLSAREYIERYHYSMAECHHQVAISSMKFLEKSLVWAPGTPPFQDFPAVAIPNRSDPAGPCLEHTILCYYVIENVLWHAHALDSPTFNSFQLSNLLRNFFEPTSLGGSSCFKAWVDLLVRFDGLMSLHHRRDPKDLPLQSSSTPFQVMSVYGLFHTVKSLWERAGDGLHVVPIPSLSPIDLAIMLRRESIWKFILLAKESLKNGSQGSLITAIHCDHMEAFDALLEAEADVNHVCSSEMAERLAKEFCKTSPSMPLELTQWWWYYMAKRAMKEPNETWPATPLEAALWCSKLQRRRDFLKKLLDRGADVNFKTRFGTTLEVAVQHSDEEAVRMLLDRNKETYSPGHLLSLATQNRNFNLVPFFVNLGAAIEEPWEGVLPLVRALRKRNVPALWSLLELSGTYIDLLYQDHRETLLSILPEDYGKDNFCFPLEYSSHKKWNRCEQDTLLRAVRSYPKYQSQLQGIGFDRPDFAFHTAVTVRHRIDFVTTLLEDGADPSVSVTFGSGRSSLASAVHKSLFQVRVLLDQETFQIKQEQRGLFQTALFGLMSRHLGILSGKFTDSHRKLPSNESLLTKYLEALQLLFDGDLNVYVPMSDFLDSLPPPVCTIGEAYEMNDQCQLYFKGYFGFFSRLWLSIMWDLQNSTSPLLPLRSALRRWRFPRTLPSRFTIVTRLKALSSAQKKYYIKLSVRGHRSQFSILPVHMEVCRSLSHRSDDKRWVRYKPEDFGVIKYSNS